MWFDDLAAAVRAKYETEKGVPQDTPTPTIDDFGIVLIGNAKWAEPVRDEVMERMDALLEAYIDRRRAVLSTLVPPGQVVLHPAQVGRDLYNVLYHHAVLQHSTSVATVREVLWAVDAMDDTTNRTCLHPLAPLIKQWFTRPLPVARNKHSGPGIMVAPWQIDESAPRSGRLLRYFPSLPIWTRRRVGKSSCRGSVMDAQRGCRRSFGSWQRVAAPKFLPLRND